MKKLFAPLLLALVFFSTTAHGAFKINTSRSVGTLSSGLVGHWSMDGNKVNWGTGKVKDSAANSYDATMFGSISTSTSPREGKIGQALNLDGTNDYLDVAQDTPFDFASSFSLSTWVRVPAPSTSNIILWKTNSFGLGYGVSGIGTANKWHFNIYNGSGWTVSTPSETVVPNRWYHLVGVFDDTANTISLYVDGAVSDSDAYASTAANSGYHLHIGNFDFDPDGGYFRGDIDDVRIYNRALSASEVKQLYTLSR